MPPLSERKVGLPPLSREREGGQGGLGGGMGGKGGKGARRRCEVARSAQRGGGGRGEAWECVGRA